MYRALSIVVLSLMLRPVAVAQWGDLNYQMGGPMLTAILDGYELVDSLGKHTSRSNVLDFGPGMFDAGYMYLIMVFTDGCTECPVRLQLIDPSTQKSIDLEAETQRDGKFSMTTKYADQAESLTARLRAYVLTDESYRTVGVLMRKKK